MKTRLSYFLTMAGAVISLLFSSSASAGSFSVIHNSDDLNETNGNAITVAMPPVDGGAIRIHRIRLSTTKGTALNYRFRSNRDTTSLGDTTAMSGWTCTLPGCQDVFSIEGVQAGELYDFKGLDLTLPPGHRLHVFTDADIGISFVTLEVFASNR